MRIILWFQGSRGYHEYGNAFDRRVQFVLLTEMNGLRQATGLKH